MKQSELNKIPASSKSAISKQQKGASQTKLTNYETIPIQQLQQSIQQNEKSKQSQIKKIIESISNSDQYEQELNQNTNELALGLNNYDVQDEIKNHLKIIENMWDYRYWRLVDNAIANHDWIPIFAFIGEFKLKCVGLAKKLVEDRFSIKEIDKINHRYALKGEGELGIYMIDGVIIRVAKVTKNNKEFDKRAEKNLHQQFISSNMINDLIISFAIEMPNFPTLRVPLTCLVKYLGYTFLCQSDTMCNGIETLIYGAMGNTFKFKESIKNLLNVIGRNLNLKSFNILTLTKNMIQIPFCLTSQVHQINQAFRDGKMINWFNPQSRIYPCHQNQNKLKKPQYYLFNFSKLWPLFIDNNIVASSGYLRPEAVLSWKKQLSNSVFCNIAYEKDEEGELQLAEACKFVKQENIKQLAIFLDEATFFVVDSVGIEEIMHYYRINMRLLGQVAHKFTLDINRKVFEVEMVARVLKKQFYGNIDGLEERYRIRELLADFLNFVFLVNAESEKFYLDIVYPHVQKYYEYKIKEYPPTFSGGGLFHALCYHLGIKLKTVDYPIFKNMQVFYHEAHILDFIASAKSFQLDTCELKKSCQKFKIKKKEGNMSQCLNELKVLSIIARLSSPQFTYSNSSPPESYFYSELAEVYLNLGQHEKTFHYLQLASKGIPEKHADLVKISCTYMKYYGDKKQMTKCNEHYQKALTNITFHLHQTHPLSISVNNTLGYELLNCNADTAKCQKTFLKSFEVCEQALGYMHSTSGKILLQLADLPLSPQKTIHFLLQALTILQNIETDKSKVRNVCKKISLMYAKMNNLAKMVHFSRKSEDWTNEIIGLQKLHEYKMVLQLCGRPANNIQQLKFLIEKSFSAYIKQLNLNSSFNLYKLFIALVQHLPKTEVSCDRIYKKLTTQFTITVTIVQYVKTTLNSLLNQIPELLKQNDFYVGPQFLLNYNDGKLKICMITFMDILSIVGKEKAEQIFTEFRNKF